MRRMKIAMLSSEVVPFSKTGGLADVAGALPKFLGRAGADVRVITPLYRETKKRNLPLRPVGKPIELDWLGEKDRFSAFEHQEDGVTFLFVDRDDYFGRDFLYGTPQGDYPDNGERFAFFSKAALEMLKSTGFRPDVVHVHDWQSAVALAYLKFAYDRDPFFAHTKSLLTIHNLAYQGLFEGELLDRIGLPERLFNMEDMEFYGKISFLKAGILYATAVNTVSKRYSQEIQTPELGARLDGLLGKRSDSVYGILNGVDYAGLSPATDKFIARPFDPTYLDGKKECKRDVLQAFSLEAGPDEPAAP